MMKKYQFLFITTILILIGCSSNNESVNPVNQYGDLSQPLKDSLKIVTGDNQVFVIDATIENTVIGENGTVLMIPKGSIVSKDGSMVTGDVIIELKESFTMSDFIASNLQTKHNESLLESKGMIFFNAKDKEGNDLRINQGKSIRIEIPQDDLNNNPKIFLGSRNEEGTINWGIKKEPSKTLVPYPIRLVSQIKVGWTECSNYYGITTDTTDRWSNFHGNIEDFERTFLATKEFRKRYHSYCNEPIIDIYSKFIGKTLWEADEAMVEHLMTDSVERIKFWNKDWELKKQSRTQEQIENHEKWIENRKNSCHRRIERFRKFASQKLTNIDTTLTADTAALNNLNKAFIAYQAMDFGWVNVDFFYEDENAKPIKLSVKSNVECETVNLIIKGRNVILSTNSLETPRLYPITKKNSRYSNLPVGEKGVLIAMSVSPQYEILFAKKEIVIGESEIENLELKVSSGNEIKAMLEELDK